MIVSKETIQTWKVLCSLEDASWNFSSAWVKNSLSKKHYTIEDSAWIASLIFPINLSHLHRLRHRRCCCRCRFCCSFHCFGHVFLDLLQLLPYWNWLEHITGLPKAPNERNAIINCWFWGMGNVPRVCWKLLRLEAGPYWSKLWVWLCKAQPLWLDDLHQEQPISTWKFQGLPTLTQKRETLLPCFNGSMNLLKPWEVSWMKIGSGS